MNTNMFILHPVHQSRQMNLLEDFYIQCFQQRNTGISEQSQEYVEPLFDLIYDTQLNHACAWFASTSLMFGIWLEYREACQPNIILLYLVHIILTSVSSTCYNILSTNVLITSYAYIFPLFQDDYLLIPNSYIEVIEKIFICVFILINTLNHIF